jgi:hypothetical protein
MESIDAYLARKRREAALINGCLAASLTLDAPESAAGLIDMKFKVAAALRAERSLQSWAITETARPEVQRWHSGAYEFSYGYQRADLQVRGPAIYGAIRASRTPLRQETLYTGSGMSAIAVVVTAMLRLRRQLEVIAPRGCYGETRELLQSLDGQITILPFRACNRLLSRTPGVTRVLLLDSSVAARFEDYRRSSTAGVDLVIFDTTCFWQGSSRIAVAVDWALRSGIPMVLVRSHAKLDSLGIEYGRLGSVVILSHPQDDAQRWMKALFRATEDSVRLYGVAAIPAHFPPFTGTDEYHRESRARTAAIIRNTRRMARELTSRLERRQSVRQFQHGLYFVLVPGGELQLEDVKGAAAALSGSLGRQGLPVKHAGSFGFDFVAAEWFFDAILRRNVVRVTGADLPRPLIDRIIDAIADWWWQHTMSSVHRRAGRVVAAREATPS